MTKKLPTPVGVVFGSWTVLAEAEPRIQPAGGVARMMRCQCRCGSTQDVKLASLRNGTSSACAACRPKPKSRKKEVALGTVFGSLTVTRELEPRRFPSGQTKRMVECQCSCGAVVSVQLANLRSGNTTTCDTCRPRKLVKHGKSKSLEYRSWLSMHQRCYNPEHDNFQRYGGRGVYVHERWHKDNPKGFENFLEDLGPKPSPRHTLDKDGIVHENLCYGPGLCQWATPKEQGRLRKTCRVIEFQGRSQSVAAWAEELGMTRHQIYSRLDWGWSVEDALTTPLGSRRKSKPEQAA